MSSTDGARGGGGGVAVLSVALVAGTRTRLKVLERLEQHDIDTTLIPVLASGVNDHEIGALIEFAFAKRFVAECEEKVGLGQVEAVLDAAHALMNQGVSRTAGARRERTARFRSGGQSPPPYWPTRPCWGCRASTRAGDRRRDA